METLEVGEITKLKRQGDELVSCCMKLLQRGESTELYRELSQLVVIHTEELNAEQTAWGQKDIVSCL